MKTTLIVLAMLMGVYSIVAIVMTYATTRDDSTEWFLSGFVSLLVAIIFFAFHQAEAWREMYEQATRPKLWK